VLNSGPIENPRKRARRCHDGQRLADPKLLRPTIDVTFRYNAITRG
jgi:hypothetical protein